MEGSCGLQTAPGQMTDNSKATGVSGFAFQGTNAHVLLRSCAADCISSPIGVLPSPQTSLDRHGHTLLLEGIAHRTKVTLPIAGTKMLPPWYRQYFWLLPKPFHLCTSFIHTGASTVFDIALDGAGLAYLWQHQVWPLAAISSIPTCPFSRCVKPCRPQPPLCQVPSKRECLP